MKQELEEKFTRYEIARILGARSLQLAMDAPLLLKLTEEEEAELNYDTLRIAEKEFEEEVLPITVKRPLPKKSEKQIKKLTEEEVKEKMEIKAEKEKKEIEKLEQKKEQLEEREEKEIVAEGEIMEIANPTDEEEISDEVVKEA
ncbi:DNA-directed RNA polymerase subunit K [Candidatus Pacearchaeota archaeon]|nr:DNA-directed RNA polymerase subunit K [Candidatus Pacearchaeota archaeon]|tara:strand:+ start:399 stop:830 length:432 start_codon:yes stop_codon:yes gene_type:complete